MPEMVLIVDDDPVQRRLLEAMVQRFGYRTVVVKGGDAAVKLLVGPDAARIDGVVLDLVMPDLDGLGVLARMREANLHIPVIVQTAHGGIDNVVSAMRAGATDFVVKPASAERLQVSLRNALATNALAGELQRLRRKHDGTLTIGDVISRSPAKGWAVLDAGLKAFGMDHGDPSVLPWHDGVVPTVFFCSDEHTTFASEAKVRVGERVRLWPAHVDPTVAYHERIVLVEGDEVVGDLPVDLRGW